MTSKSDEMAGTGAVRSVTRALSLLTTLSSEGLSLTEASQRADIPLPTALRLMRTLERESFAVRLEDGRFVLGPAAVRLAYEADPEGPLRWTVRETVTRLRDRIGETTAFFVRRGSERLCLEAAESRHPVRWVCRRGMRSALHLSASGKVLMAYGPTEDLLDGIPVRGGKFELANGGLRSVEELRKELLEVRSTGVASSERESTVDSWGFGLPFIVRGVCLGAFGFGLPVSRSRSSRDALVEECSEVIATVTDELMLRPLSSASADGGDL